MSTTFGITVITTLSTTFTFTNSVNSDTFNVTGPTTTTHQSPVDGKTIIWIVTDSSGSQYNAYPPFISTSVPCEFTITAPCTTDDGTNKCVRFINASGSTAVITNLPEPNIDELTTLYIVSGTNQQTASLPIGSTWRLPDGEQFTVTSTNEYVLYPIIIQNLTYHTYMTNYKQYSTITNIGILGGLFLIGFCILLFFVKRNNNTQNATTTAAAENLDATITAALTSPSGGGKGWFLMFLAFLYFCAAVIAFTAMYVANSSKYATYEQCSAKDGFGLIWRWAVPSQWLKKQACILFGFCECVSDAMEATCNSFAVTNNTFTWDETAAAQSIDINDSCFCCSSSGCVDINSQVCSSR